MIGIGLEKNRIKKLLQFLFLFQVTLTHTRSLSLSREYNWLWHGFFSVNTQKVVFAFAMNQVMALHKMRKNSPEK